MKRVLLLEPYYGGSHRYFLEGLQRHVPADYLLLSLPARKWKMRMQLSAPWFVEQLKSLPVGARRFDTVLCSSFVDVAVFRSLLTRVAGWHNSARILTYFHENQFVYPQRLDDSLHHLFASINFHSALASDGIAFNSEYNRESFFAGCRNGLQAAPDMQLPGALAEICGKSRVLFPGIDFAPIDALAWRSTVDVPVIVWNHRWEHDKNPQAFFLALENLEQRGIDFRLLVLGQSFLSSPGCFLTAEKRFAGKILHYGYVPSYQQYIELLNKGDIVVSTSLHEFYGISVLEAVRAGCVPLLPDRLSYPELFDKKFLYRDPGLPEVLEKAIQERRRLTPAVARAMTEPFSWLSLHGQYAKWLGE